MAKKEKLSERIVAFVDVLGFSSYTRSFTEDQSDLALEIIEALEPSVRRFTTGRQDLRKGLIDLKISSFSDCFVVSAPPVPSACRYVLDTVTEIACDLLLADTAMLFSRGGIAQGLMIHHAGGSRRTDTVFGPGFIDAHDLEQGTAHYPRIVLADSVAEQFEREQDAPRIVYDAGRVTASIEQDHDGIFFLDLFQSLWEAASTAADVLRIFSRLRCKLVKNLDDAQKNYKYLARWRWCARQFNGARQKFLDKFPEIREELLEIESGKGRRDG